MVMDARGGSYDFKALALTLCKLTGADGFMAVDVSEKADFRLHFYNADGSRGEMCGNGSRCICRFAYEMGMAGAEMSVETDAGIVYGRRLDENRYAVRLNNPGIVDLHRKDDCAYIELGDPGVPHAVAECPDLDWDTEDSRKEYYRSLRYDPAFPKGANVNFYRWIGENEVRVLTFERGVEDFTLACGTGCGSIASILWTKGQLPGGVLTAQNRGGTLTVTVSGEEGTIRSIFLEGTTEVVKFYEM
jgi:diaminopimelate epimerase